MAFNKENLNKWSELAPSLQKRFKDLEDAIKNQQTNINNKTDNARITFGYAAPSKPVNNAELWIDEKNRILRAYADSNWEFTRAAWYGGVKPDVAESGSTTIKPPTPYEPTEHNDIYFTFNPANTPNTQWSVNSDDGNGNVSHMFVFNSSKPISVRVQIDMSKVTNRTDNLGFLLAVFGKAYNKDNPSDTTYTHGTIDWGKGVAWKLGANLNAEGKIDEEITDASKIISAPDTSQIQTIDLKLDTGYYCVFDIDCKSHAFETIWPGDMIKTETNDTQGSTYFGNTVYHDYCLPISTWKEGSPWPTRPFPNTSYASPSAPFTVTITCKSTY